MQDILDQHLPGPRIMAAARFPSHHVHFGLGPPHPCRSGRSTGCPKWRPVLPSNLRTRAAFRTVADRWQDRCQSRRATGGWKVGSGSTQTPHYPSANGQSLASAASDDQLTRRVHGSHHLADNGRCRFSLQRRPLGAHLERNEPFFRKDLRQLAAIWARSTMPQGWPLRSQVSRLYQSYKDWEIKPGTGSRNRLQEKKKQQ